MSKELPKHLIPSDPLEIGAWATALKVFIGREDCIQQYIRDTGDKYRAPNIPVEQLIAESSGEEHEFVIRFITCFNTNIWKDG